MGKFNKVWLTTIVAVIVAVVSLWWWQASIDSESAGTSGSTLNQTSEKGENKKECLTKAKYNQSICGAGAYKKFASDMKRCENKLNEQLKLKRLSKLSLNNPEASYGACEDLAKADFGTAQSMCTATANSQKNQCSNTE